MPKFSFVIPCYEASSTLARCLGSIYDQDYKDFEVICVLDGPDEIAERIAKAFKAHVEIIEHGGVQRARNHGLKVAQGEYVLFSDPDMYWDPGVLRLHKEAFEKYGVDFTYSGYRWSDMEGGHLPPDFDPHLLTVSNYIDGANPVKRELAIKVGGWDEKIERFQDWDFWLRIVKAGGVGRKLDIDVSRSTDKPTEKSISGKDNYEQWFTYVRKKHQTYDRDICLTSIAAPGHASRIAKACNWDYWHDPAMLAKDYKAIYLLGMFPEGIQEHVSLFRDRKGGNRKCKYIIHWIGTDVLNMRLRTPFLSAKNIRLMFEKHGIINLCQSEENAEEMREIGFKDIKVLPLPLVNEFEPYPLPEKFSVSVYTHGGIDEKWHKWLIMELVKAMPDVHWVFYGDKNAVGGKGNQEWLGHVPIKDVIKKSTCHLRLTVHDGYPVAPVEFMLSGRKVITNVKDMPFTNYLDLGVITEERVIEIKKLVHDEIRKVKHDPVFKQYEMAKYHYETLLDPKTFKEKIEALVNE